MTGARTNTLASLRGSIERIEAHAERPPRRVALGHADADATLQGGLAPAAVHEVFAEGPAERRRRRASSRASRAAGAPTRGRWSGSGRILPRSNPARCRWRAGRTRPRSAAGGDRARRRCRRRVAHRRRRAGLRCAGRGGAGSLGRGPAVRSRRQPQADAGGAGLRRHRPVAAGGGAAAALDGGDAMDRARGAFAAGQPGARGARRCSTRNSSAIVMARSAGGSWNGNVMSAFSRTGGGSSACGCRACPSTASSASSRRPAPRRLTGDNEAQHRRRQAEQCAADFRAR